MSKANEIQHGGSHYKAQKIQVLRVTHKSFLKHIDFEGPVHPTCGRCWQWTGSVQYKGYGQHNLGKKRGGNWRAHKLMYTLIIGKVPEGSKVLHKCDNRRCVNPDHLYLGTDAQNSKDMIDRERSLKGHLQPTSKFTPQVVSDLRQKYASGKWSYEKLAKLIGSTYVSVYRAVNRITYRNVP